MTKNVLFLSLALWMIMACQSTNSARSGSSESYTEDLSIYRPTFSHPADTVETINNENSETSAEEVNVAVEHDITRDLNQVLEESDEFRKQVKYVDGFTIQVYSGTQSEEARKIRGKVLGILPDEDAQLIYDEPSFKVKVGKYFSRLEAQTSFGIVKEEFPTAIIIPERIPLVDGTD